jgi:hypothetical protein
MLEEREAGVVGGNFGFFLEIGDCRVKFGILD